MENALGMPEEDDDLCFYDLPEVADSELHEPGQCIRNKKPYPGEPEHMILEVNRECDYYLCQVVEEGGKAGFRSRISIRDVHHYYEKI